MEKKYEIHIHIAGENPQALGTRTRKRKLFFFKTPPLMEWVGFADKDARILKFDRDEAKYILTHILGGSHRERQWWANEWDYLKMVACIRKSPRDVVSETVAYSEHPVRYVKLVHALWVEIKMIDTSKDGFAVYEQYLDYFTSQNLTLQD
jgi:hypothetical protein